MEISNFISTVCFHSEQSGLSGLALYRVVMLDIIRYVNKSLADVSSMLDVDYWGKHITTQIRSHSMELFRRVAWTLGVGKSSAARTNKLLISLILNLFLFESMATPAGAAAYSYVAYYRV